MKTIRIDEPLDTLTQKQLWIMPDPKPWAVEEFLSNMKVGTKMNFWGSFIVNFFTKLEDE